MESEDSQKAENEYPEDEEVTFKKKRGKFSRRTQGEIAIGFVVHVIMLFYWVFVHVYDATIVKGLSADARKAAFPTYEEFFGRWRHLTYINMWSCLVYFFLAFFADIIPRSSAKGLFQNVVDFMFASVVFPLALMVQVTFWGLYAIDREGIHPTRLDGILPPLLNHLWHSLVAVAVLIELLLVFHPFPRTLRVASTQFALSIVYTVLIVYLRQTTGKWVYPFLGKIPPPLIPVFFAGGFVLTLVLFFISKGLAYLRWGERITASIKGEVKED